MSVNPGTRLGVYQIAARIGEGGMGQVYRATDTKLKRQVALKILPPSLAADHDRLARFQREAEVLASLNHPHIASIYGLEESAGITALVMELVEGDDLSQRIARGAISIEEALPIAKQIAEALEAAHDKGIIHRDLKPANVMLTSAGAVKVLDFGLAKIVLPYAANPDVTEEPTTTVGATERGMVLGTAAYMSPEQARGQLVDKRSDVWAFGCVLYEMLTGRAAFAASTLSDTLASILKTEPDLHRLPPDTPPAIRRLLQRCLTKDAKNRLHDIADARLDVDDGAREPSAVAVAAGSAVGRGSLWRPTAWTAAGAGGALFVTLMAGGLAGPSERPRSLVVTSVLVERLPLAAPGVHFAVAPSGGTVVFSGNYGGSRVLFRRDLDRVDPQPIVGTEDGSDVFVSPDGRWLGFERPSELWTGPLDGGTPQRLLPNQPLRGGTWGEGDRIVFGKVGSGLWLASAMGGEPRQLTFPEDGQRHELPQMLPGGRAVLFTILAASGPPRVAAYVLATGETRALFEGMGARFAGSGHVVFGRQGKLWAVGFDPDRLQTRGAARPVRDDVLWSAAGYPQFAVDGGLLAYVRTQEASGKVVPVLVDRQGTAQVLPLAADNYLPPRFSPAGDRFVAQVGAARELWTYDVSRGALARLTSDRIIAYSAPTWTADGSRVVFTTWFDGDVGLGWLAADGSGPVQLLVKGLGMRSFEDTNPIILSDGSAVILTGLAPGATVEDLLIVRLAEKKSLETLLHAAGVERNPAIAPNGRLLAYNSDESGHPEVYVRPFPNVGARRWRVSTDGGGGPVWTRNGTEMVYQDRQGRIMAVAVQRDSNDEFHFSKPDPLFTYGAGVGRGSYRSFDVTADGERFLFLAADPNSAGSETTVELTLIHNWAEELKRLVP